MRTNRHDMPYWEHCAHLTAVLTGTDHILCDKSSPSGCTRCILPASNFCCDLCHPDYFAQHIPPAPPKKPSRPRRSPLPKTYVRPPSKMPLAESLKIWRRDEAIKRYGAGRFRLLGAGLVMNDDVLDRIVDFVEKIKTREDLGRELHDWNDLPRYCTQILSLIDAYTASIAPPPPPPPECEAPIQDNATTAPAQAKTRAPPRCSECGIAGHYSKWYKLSTTLWLTCLDLQRTTRLSA